MLGLTLHSWHWKTKLKLPLQPNIQLANQQTKGSFVALLVASTMNTLKDVFPALFEQAEADILGQAVVTWH